MNAHVCFEVEVKGESLVAKIAFVWFFASVDQHMPLELGVIEEALATSIVGALEQLIAVDSIVFLQACSVVEDFATGLQRASKHLWLLLGAPSVWSTTHQSSCSLLEKTSTWLRARVQRRSLVLAIYGGLLQTFCLLRAGLCRIVELLMLLVEPVFLIVSSHQFSALFRITSVIVVGEHLVLVFESIVAIELAGHAHSKEVRLILRVAYTQQVVAIGCQILEGLQVV